MSFCLDNADEEGGGPPLKLRKINSSLSTTITMLQRRYLNDLENDEECWSENYTELALVKDEKVKKEDIKNLEEFTKLTLQGQVDKLLRSKEQLNDLRDIFHYKGKPCPQLILIMGCPG